MGDENDHHTQLYVFEQMSDSLESQQQQTSLMLDASNHASGQQASLLIDASNPNSNHPPLLLDASHSLLMYQHSDHFNSLHVNNVRGEGPTASPSVDELNDIFKTEGISHKQVLDTSMMMENDSNISKHELVPNIEIMPEQDSMSDVQHTVLQQQNITGSIRILHQNESHNLEECQETRHSDVSESQLDVVESQIVAHEDSELPMGIHVAEEEIHADGAYQQVRVPSFRPTCFRQTCFCSKFFVQSY